MTNPATVKSSASSKPIVRRSVGVAIAALLAVGGLTTVFVWQFQASQFSDNSETQLSQPQIRTVTALGRLEPEGEIILLSAPTSTEGSRVERLLLKEGDTVKVNQVIAILDSRDRLQAALEEELKQVRVAQAKLAQVRAGAKSGEIQAQRSEIARLQAERSGNLDAQAAAVARLEAELQTTQTEYQRYESLYQDGATSASQRDSKKLAFATAQKQLQEARAALKRIQSASQQQIEAARATLAQIAEVRPVDVQAAQAEVERAQAAAKRVQENLDQAYIRSPQAGQILKIHARSGELVSNETGVAEIGQTQHMYAVAEVYQSDIRKVRVGQPVQVKSESLPGEELHGTVERIGLQVQRQEVINSDPSDNIDSRIVEVKVRLDASSSQKVAELTNLQVKVVIQL